MKKYKDLTQEEKEDITVTVCDRCLKASCFYWVEDELCDEFEESDTKELSIIELEKLNKEDPEHWEYDIKTSLMGIKEISPKMKVFQIKIYGVNRVFRVKAPDLKTAEFFIKNEIGRKPVIQTWSIE